MIINFVLNLLNVIVRYVHIRVIFPEFFIYTDRFALIVLNFDVMFKIRLSLLVVL